MDNIKVIVFDLDNTIWNWLDIWYRSHQARMKQIEKEFNIPAAELTAEIQAINRKAGTSEYTTLTYEIETLRRIEPDRNKYEEKVGRVQHAFFSTNKHELSLYPNVEVTLNELRARGYQLVAFTDSIKYWAVRRIQHLELDGVFKALYSTKEESVESLIDPKKFRYNKNTSYALQKTKEIPVSHELRKPKKEILEQIAQSERIDLEQLLMVGDSLFHDVRMAKEAGARSAWAKYGDHRDSEAYELLRSVSHWTDEDIKLDAELKSKTVTPDVVLKTSICELLPHLG